MQQEYVYVCVDIFKALLKIKQFEETQSKDRDRIAMLEDQLQQARKKAQEDASVISQLREQIASGDNKTEESTVPKPSKKSTAQKRHKEQEQNHLQPLATISPIACVDTEHNNHLDISLREPVMSTAPVPKQAKRTKHVRYDDESDTIL